MKKLKKRLWSAHDIKALRLRHELTQAELAEIVGVTQPMIQLAESGKHVAGRFQEIAWDRIEEHLRKQASRRNKK